MTTTTSAGLSIASLAPETADWLWEQRKIPHEVAARCNVVTVGGHPAFEFWKDGSLQYRKVRIGNPDGGKSFRRDRSNVVSCLFLEHALQEDPDLSSPLVITEGEIDALSLVAVGVPNVVSVPDGAQLAKPGEGKIVPDEDKPFEWLWEEDRLKPHIAQFERVVIAVDGDRKGRILREELAVRLDRWRCYFVVWPQGCKDANDVLVEYGEETLRRVIHNAKPLVPDRLVSFSDIPDNAPTESYLTGFKGLDEGLGIRLVPPELVVITGEPGSGKSELAVAMGAHIVAQHGIPGAILQFEDRTSRVRATLTRFATGHLELTEDKASEWVGHWFRTIEPQQVGADDVDYTLDWLKGTIREARVRHGCRWVICDPWNELDHMWDRTLSEALYTNDALKQMKKIARTYNIVLIIVAHPTKDGGNNITIEQANLYSISGGAAWNNKADHGIIVHRPDKGSADVYVKVSKSKDHLLMGRPGIVRMKYIPSTAEFKYVGMGV